MNRDTRRRKCSTVGIEVHPDALVLRLHAIDEFAKNLLHARGRQVHVSFCPERIAEGKAFSELRALPQIISAFSSEGVERANALFSCLTDEIIHLLPLEAELAKLFNNVHRYIKFSIANQFYKIANDYGLDFYLLAALVDQMETERREVGGAWVRRAVAVE